MRSLWHQELPFQTYERLSGEKWPGGKSREIVALLRILRIEFAPGSPEANLGLQDRLTLLQETFPR